MKIKLLGLLSLSFHINAHAATVPTAIMPAEKIAYQFSRGENTPALPETLATATTALEETGLVSLETDGYGSTIDWLDQIWVNQDYSQAMFLKFDLKPQDETLVGKKIKLEKGLLMHGRQESGMYFTAFFYGFDDKSASDYFQKVVESKSKTAFHFSLIPSAEAAQTVNTCGSVIGVTKGLYTVIKEYKWTCLKSFIKRAFGGVVATILNSALSVLDGTVWNKVGKNWDYLLMVIGAVQKTSSSYKDLIFLPEKIRAEFVCETLGKGFTAASAAGKNIQQAVSNFAKSVAGELYSSSKYRKIIEENKQKQTAYCTKSSTSNGNKEPISSLYNGGNSAGTGSGAAGTKASSLGK